MNNKKNRQASYVLSKSTYIRGLQCIKSLYLNKHRSFLRDPLSEEQKEKFKRGHSIGIVAQELFPNGITLGRPSKKAQEQTLKLIAEETPVIYEACFIYNEVIVALDILVRNNDKWDAYEVKSSTALSTTYYNDAALQHYIISNSGIDIGKFYLVYRDEEYEMVDNTVELEAFIKEDVTDYCKSNIDFIEQNINRFKDVLLLPNSPKIEPDVQCLTPYPCDFIGFCWKNLSEERKNEILDDAGK